MAPDWNHHAKSRSHTQRNCRETQAVNQDHTQRFLHPGPCVWK